MVVALLTMALGARGPGPAGRGCAAGHARAVLSTGRDRGGNRRRSRRAVADILQCEAPRRPQQQLAARLASPAAGADADQFLRDIAAEGWSHDRGPNAMLADGYQVCAAMDQGATIEQVTMKYLMPIQRMTSSEKARVLDLILTDLCPNHAVTHHNWLNGG